MIGTPSPPTDMAAGGKGLGFPLYAAKIGNYAAQLAQLHSAIDVCEAVLFRER